MKAFRSLLALCAQLWGKSRTASSEPLAESNAVVSIVVAQEDGSNIPDGEQQQGESEAPPAPPPEVFAHIDPLTGMNLSAYEIPEPTTHGRLLFGMSLPKNLDKNEYIGHIVRLSASVGLDALQKLTGDSV